MGHLLQAGSCERHGSTLVFRDQDGIRHAVRTSAIIAASDVDTTRDATVVQLPGGRFLMVRTCLDEVTQWMTGFPSQPAQPPVADPETLQMRLVVSNLRLIWLQTMAALLEEGVLPSRVFRDMREVCVEAARTFGNSGGALHRAVGAKGVEDLSSLFAKLLPDDKPHPGA